MENKRQHYVPRSYLRAFTDLTTPQGQEPYIWVYERGQEPYAKAPHKLAVKNYYYSMEIDGQRDNTVEELLERVETSAIPVIKNLYSGMDPRELTEEPRSWVAYFIALMSLRIPKFRETVEKFTAEVMRKISLMGARNPKYFERTMREAYAAKGLPPPTDIEGVRQFVLAGEYTVTADPGHSLQMFVQLAPDVAKLVYDCSWRLLEAPTNSAFITSDSPLVKVATKRLPPPWNMGTGWHTPWMEATLPLSPSRCLLMSLHHPEGIERISAQQLQDINWRTAAHAHEGIYSSSEIDPRSLDRPGSWEWWIPASTEQFRTPEEGSVTPGE